MCVGGGGGHGHTDRSILVLNFDILQRGSNGLFKEKNIIFQWEGDPTFSREGVQLLFPMENYMYRSREFPWWSAPPPPPLTWTRDRH